MIIAIESKNSEKYQQKVQEFGKMTPFDKVRSQLIVKIKETYLPEYSAGGANNVAELDFTGGPSTMSSGNTENN